MSIYLSKSKYCKGKQCPKMLWLEKYKPEEAEEAKNESVLKKGNQIGEIAKGIFGEHIDIQYNEDLNIMVEETKKTYAKQT